MRRASKDCMTFIIAEESMVDRDRDGNPEAYVDPTGHQTVGFGHKVLSGESFPPEISHFEAMRLFAQDLYWAEAAVNKETTGVELTQYQFDALVSFVYNIGAVNFRHSTLLKRLRAGEYIDVPEQLGRWVYGGPKNNKRKIPGLIARRARETLLWLGVRHG